MKKDLEDLLAKIAWEGDLLYVLENYEDLVPEDKQLRGYMETLHTALKNFNIRLNNLCAEHGVDPDEYDY
jgi:hypothetical protein